MTIYTITYDLIKNKDYKKLWDELENLGAHRALDSYWLVNLENTAKEVHNHFKSFIDDDDKLWVSELTKNYHWNKANKGTKEWLKNNKPSR